MCYVISVNVTENVPSSILKNAKKRGYHIHLGAPQQKVSTHHSAMQKKKEKKTECKKVMYRLKKKAQKRVILYAVYERIRSVSVLLTVE